MPYCPNVDEALAYAVAQVGDSSGGATLPHAARNRIWNDSYAEVRGHLQGAGLTVVTTTDSDALEWVRGTEALLTSGLCLRAQTTIGQGDQPASHQYIDEARERLAWAKTAAGYGALLTMGATATNPTASWRNRSNWTEGMDPDYDETPGTGDSPYAVPPQVYEGDPT